MNKSWYKFDNLYQNRGIYYATNAYLILSIVILPRLFYEKFNSTLNPISLVAILCVVYYGICLLINRYLSKNTPTQPQLKTLNTIGYVVGVIFFGLVFWVLFYRN